MKLPVALLCVCFVAGCSSVLMKEPFPESKLADEEHSQLEGVWHIGDGVVIIAFASNGTPWMATVDWEDDDFVLNKSRLYFTKRNDSFYVCMPSEPGKTNEYIFAEFNLDSGKALVWTPDEDIFEELIGSGTLKGFVEKDKHSKSISLETKAEEILELISTNSAVFDYKSPLLFQKLD